MKRHANEWLDGWPLLALAVVFIVLALWTWQ